MTLQTHLTEDLSALQNRTIAIIGYGSQGRAHAQNLRDSGFDILLGLRPNGASAARARAEGFEICSPAEAAKRAQLIALLIPDMAQKDLFDQEIAPHLNPGNLLLFAHGFSRHYGRISPPGDIDIALIAPKSPGDLVRREFARGRGVPCLMAIDQDATGHARARALAYAAGLGGTRAGIIETSFAEETETDLFGEQAILCGGAMELLIAGFETLTDAGYQPEIAYFECLHELKLIVDLIQEGGLGRMFDFISETATQGALTQGPRLINEDARARMKEILADIRSGQFARDWIAENDAGLPNYRTKLADARNHAIEKTGADLRARMAWLAEPAIAEAAE